MRSHLLQHLPSSRSQVAFQASSGIRERDTALCIAPAWRHLWMQHSGHSACTEATNTTKTKGDKSNCKSKPQQFAQGNNPRSSFKSSLELSRRWTWCCDRHAGFHDHTLWPYTHNTKPDYHTYCWGKANMSDLWERKSSRISPTVTNQGSVGNFPFVELKHPCKAKDMSLKPVIRQLLCAASPSYYSPKL